MRNGMQIITLGVVQCFQFVVSRDQFPGPFLHQCRQMVPVFFQFEVVVDSRQDDGRVERFGDVIDRPQNQAAGIINILV